MGQPRGSDDQNSLFAASEHGTLKLFLYGMAAIALMVADHRGDHLDRVRSWIGVGVSPVYHLIDMPGRIGRWLSDSLSSREGLLDENRALKDEQLLLRAQIREVAVLRAENDRLRRLLDATKDISTEASVAELLSVDLDPFRHRVVIDRGQSSGVSKGQVLVDVSGVLGQVVDVSRYTAHAMLITDPAHALPVEINRTAARAIAYGTGSTEILALPDLPQSIDLRVGDLVVTSGLGGRFARGLAVGRIASFSKPDGEPLAYAVIEPAAAMDRSREVLLLTSTTQVDIGPPLEVQPEADQEPTP
ncbi:MAG: cell shape-determining protein MreC [Lysobacteraceae bacterium]|nr:MAG: cell shape-determining protein MreC [Xanthomonadaceae bacterium]